MTADQWNDIVFPSIRGQFQHLRSFGDQFLNQYDEISPLLKNIEDGKVDNATVEEELKILERDLIIEGVSKEIMDRELSVSICIP